MGWCVFGWEGEIISVGQNIGEKMGKDRNNCIFPESKIFKLFHLLRLTTKKDCVSPQCGK